jgi:hypothetical protein
LFYLDVNELTFKGDFWVNDTTFAIKKINMAVTKSANINWVKDIYIEQDLKYRTIQFFLLTRDYMSDCVKIKRRNQGGCTESEQLYIKSSIQYRNQLTFMDEVNFVDNTG